MQRLVIAILVVGGAAAMSLAGSQAGADDGSASYSEQSVAQGKRLFLVHCPSCHGRDARARIDFVSDATDLTSPSRYRNGSTPTDVFKSLSEGAGTDMPPFQYTLMDAEDRWHLINFIISTWTPEERAAFSRDREADTANF